MKLPQLKKIKWNYSALAFFFPVIGMLVAMLFMDCEPFGSYTMLYSDMYHQYFPFFKAFRAAILSGDSLLYSWNVGMGMDYLGLIAYYLASPLNLLSVLVPEPFLLEFFSLLVPIKLGFASLFFSIFLKKVFNRNDLSITLFGCFYGLCAWALGYQWNVMWLDTFALLPLVALGTVSLLKDGRFILYTVTLFLSILSNYYIGFFTCIFVFLIFVCYQICRCKSIKRLFIDLGRIALFSILAIGMTAILELPALAALQTTQSSVNTFPEGFSVNIVGGSEVTAAKSAWNAYKYAKQGGASFGKLFPLWWDAVIAAFPPVLDAMEQVAGNMNGGLLPSFKEGLPNLYCGVGTIILAFLFLTTRHVKLRDKLCCVFLLIFFMLSFIFRQLDYIWHGFHFTNMIPYRFSFLYSFVMLYMAYRAYLLRRRLKLWQVLVSGVLALCILFCYKNGNDTVYFAYNGVFFILYFSALVAATIPFPLSKNATKEEKRIFIRERSSRRFLTGIALLAIMVVELILNIVNFSTNFPRTYALNYPKGTKYTESMISYMKDREALYDNELFYRAEVTHTQTLNDGALNGYNGLSTFTSSANVKVTEFTKAMGFSARNTYNRYCYENTSPVANLFLNLKYLIERDGKVIENAYFDEVHHYGDVYLLENNAYLPLGFLAQSDLGNVAFDTGASAFTFQNVLFTSATGIVDNVWDLTDSDWLSIMPTDVQINSQSASGYCSYITSYKGGKLVYTYQVEEEGLLCLDLTMNARNNFTVWKNDELLYSESLSLPQTLTASQVRPGDTIQVQVSCKANESSSMTIRAAILDEKVFRAGYDILSASTLDLTEFSNTKVEGIIHCNRDGLLYTSIPQNGDNWKVYVDGKAADPVLVGDAMICVPLDKGIHTVTFRYTNDAFSVGLVVYLICFWIFALLVIFANRPKKQQH